MPDWIKRPPCRVYNSFMDANLIDAMTKEIWMHTPWEQRDAPRREYWLNDFGMSYTYGSGEHARTYEGHLWGESLTGIMASLLRSSVGDVMFTNTHHNCCFINGYEGERQHLGWHADDSPEMDHFAPIAVVSLGAEREIWVRPKDHKGPIPDEWKFTLPSGSLFHMAKHMQKDWEHRVPKAGRKCGPRVSLTYRRLTEASVLGFLLGKAANA